MSFFAISMYSIGGYIYRQCQQGFDFSVCKGHKERTPDSDGPNIPSKRLELFNAVQAPPHPDTNQIECHKSFHKRPSRRVSAKIRPQYTEIVHSDAPRLTAYT